MSLTKYHQKRKFNQTPEPDGKKKKRLRAAIWKKKSQKKLAFVVQEHHASHLHYDFRLELDGVLKSWAVPKGPSMDPSVKHLAVHVEDHPFAYRKFHGTIPKGNYGAGTVKIWDEGTYTPVEKGDDPQEILRQGLKKGDLKIVLDGKKLQGEFVLVKLKGQDKNWLLIKHKETGPRFITESVKGKRAAMPNKVTPMLAKTADGPFNNPDWIYELKWDGYRAIAEVKKGKVRLYSRNHQDFTKKYPELVASLAKIPSDVVLDGEIIAVDKKGTPRFQLLQDYQKNREDVSLLYAVFDLLYLNGYDQRGLSLVVRKELLKEILPVDSRLKYSDHIEQYGVELFEKAKKNTIEGIIAKKKNSRYVSVRSSEWLKIKNLQMQEAVICGFTKPRGQRKIFGALILGMYEGHELRYIGHTGSGFDGKKLQEISALLKPLITKESPFTVTPVTNAPATWVRPEKVCEVKFSEWTTDGQMRHPIYLGLRTDKKPEEVTGEQILKTKSSKTKPLSSKVEFSNLDKVFWQEEGYTKGDIISYYNRIASLLLPYLLDRPQSLNRHPNGITGESFYQKDILSAPSFAKRVALHSNSDSKTVHWLVCNNRDTLLYMANLGCIEINPWSSRLAKKDFPDYLIIDLDPNGADFKEVVVTALTVKKLLDKAELVSFVKTSGKTGLHILVPLGAKYSFEQARQFAELLARTVQRELPHTTSVVRDPQKREKKIYIDFLQNRRGQTITAPYSLRPVPGALVSTPLLWKELTPRLNPSDFTIRTIFKRLTKKGDIWKALLHHRGINMRKSLDKLTK
jgi:bifunctional non-homologous end joining protein LigD